MTVETSSLDETLAAAAKAFRGAKQAAVASSGARLAFERGQNLEAAWQDQDRAQRNHVLARIACLQSMLACREIAQRAGECRIEHSRAKEDLYKAKQALENAALGYVTAFETCDQETIAQATATFNRAAAEFSLAEQALAVAEARFKSIQEAEKGMAQRDRAAREHKSATERHLAECEAECRGNSEALAGLKQEESARWDELAKAVEALARAARAAFPPSAAEVIAYSSGGPDPASLVSVD